MTVDRRPAGNGSLSTGRRTRDSGASAIWFRLLCASYRNWRPCIGSRRRPIVRAPSPGACSERASTTAGSAGLRIRVTEQRPGPWFGSHEMEHQFHVPCLSGIRSFGAKRITSSRISPITMDHMCGALAGRRCRRPLPSARPAVTNSASHNPAGSASIWTNQIRNPPNTTSLIVSEPPTITIARITR